MDEPLEREIQRVGHALADAFPSHRGRPLRVLDDRASALAARAMYLPPEDAELRAALFRFVDVVPACRSLDDLAAHLTGYLEQVHGRPPSLRAAMRMGDTKAGRAALGAAGGPASGTWPTGSSSAPIPPPRYRRCAGS